MSQIQQLGVVSGATGTTGVLCIRGIEVRRSSLVPVCPQITYRQIDETGLHDLVQTWQKIKDRRSLDFSWRDKFEYQLVKLDHARGQAILCQEQHTVLRRIERANGRMWLWRPGNAKFTVEATTSIPYSPQLEDLLGLEQSFSRRRKYLRSLMNHDQAPFTLNILPDLESNVEASTGFTPSRGRERKSSYVIPQRRASVHISSHGIDGLSSDPLDIRSEPASPTSKFSRLARPRLRSVATESVLLQTKPQPEAPIFEMGTRGLQVTFGCHDLREARFLHDQLCVLSPIMLAFTASTPVYRGRLSDFDVRLHPVSKGAAEYRPGESTSLTRPWRQLYPTYLGIDAPRSRITRSNTNKDIFQRLRNEGFDDAMAAFCAQGFTCAFPQSVRKDGDNRPLPNEVIGAKLFHKFTSSLNPHVQLELPTPKDTRTGFRVTFGAMEIQLSDFENAACIFFIGLLRFAILGFDLDFRLPPHMVAENVANAHKVDAILTEKFWWRSVQWKMNGLGFHNNDQPLTTDPEPTLVSIDHIINGDPSRPETVGLSGVLDAYLADVEDGSDGGSYADNQSGMGRNDNDTTTISKYLAFIRRRAKGSIKTDARLLREFISSHPEHEEDEALTHAVWYDLVKRIEELNDGATGVRV